MTAVALRSKGVGPIIGKKDSFDFISVDVSLEETHSSSSEVTRFPVESAQVISDTVQHNPDTLSMTGIFTNIFRSADEVTKFFDGGGSEDTPPKRAENAYAALRTIHDNGTLVDVNTGLLVYENMVVTSLSVKRDKSTSDIIQFTLMLQQVRFATASVDTLVHARDASHKGTTDKGKKPPLPSTKKVEASEDSSALYEIFE